MAGLLAGLVAAVVGHFGLDELRPRRTLAGQAVAMDGDSLRLDGAELRLEGIDAPELRQTCTTPAGEVACGRAAQEALARLVAGGAVTCRVGKEDRYGRGLARCSAGGREINREMILSGQAVAYGDYAAEEALARGQRRGIWATRFELPSDWRRRH